MTSEGPIKVSVRNLSEGGGTPLRDFWGKLDHFDPRRDETYNRTLIDLGFTDVEVIESTTPYNFPIAQISIKYSTRKNSTWGIFSASVETFLSGGEDLDDLKGARFHMVMTPDHAFGKNQETQEDIVISCWEVQAVEGRETGGSTISALDQALKLLDGSTEAAWNQTVLADPVVKKDSALVGQILNRTLLPALEATGKISKDDKDIWHIDV